MSEEKGLSYNEMERLFGLLWPSIKEEIEIWIEQLRWILEDPDDEIETKDIFKAQGSLKSLRSVLQLPEQLMTTKLAEEEREGEQDE